jgi:hypothetical protein
MKSSWCKSSPVKAVAGRPVASVAIRWVTGGCEAYIASKQAARDELRNRPHCDADAVLSAEGSIRYAVMRGMAGIAGVASPRHAYQGTFREPRRAPCFSASWARWRPTQRHLVSGGRGLPSREANDPQAESPATKGNRRPQARAGEQSYDSIVPMKVENRRAPARGGHGIHWREGMNRSMYRGSATGTRR